jgi:hypothetical protein
MFCIKLRAKLILRPEAIMPHFTDIISWAIRIFLGAALFVVGVVALTAVLFQIVPEQMSSRWKQNYLGIYDYADFGKSKIMSIGANEDVSIKEWVAQCVAGSSLAPLPPEIIDIIWAKPISGFGKSPYAEASKSEEQKSTIDPKSTIRKPNNRRGVSCN